MDLTLRTPVLVVSPGTRPGSVWKVQWERDGSSQSEDMAPNWDTVTYKCRKVLAHSDHSKDVTPGFVLRSKKDFDCGRVLSVFSFL